MRNPSLLVVLVFTATIGQVWSECNLTSVGEQEVIVYVLLSHEQRVEPLTELPDLSNIKNTCQNWSCCVSDNGEEYLFPSLDDAFKTIKSEIQPAEQSLLIGLIGSKPDAHLLLDQTLELRITNLPSLTLQSFDSIMNIMCNSNAMIKLSYICSVTLQGVSFLNCGTIDKAGIEIEHAHTINIRNTIINGSPSSGLYLHLHHYEESCTLGDRDLNVSISHSKFINNGILRADDKFKTTYGGGVRLNVHHAIKLTIYNSTFLGNVASNGGGLLYHTNNPKSLIEIIDSEFNGNKAHVQGAALHIVGTDDETLSDVLVIRNSLIMNSYADEELLFSQVSCAIYSNYINISIVDSHLTNNPSTPICIRTAALILSGDVVFHFNKGNHGGAVNMVHSKLQLMSNVNVLFSCNHAVNGGGIFCGQLALTNIDDCLIDFPKNGQYNVTFSQNTAVAGGDAIYFHQPNDACRGDVDRLHIPTGDVASATARTVFHIYEPVRTTSGMMCSNSTCSIKLILGQPIVFNVTVIDYFNTSSFIQGSLVLKKNESEQRIYCGYDYPHKLKGLTHISLESGVNYPNLSITGPQIFDSFEGENHTISIIGTSERIIGEIFTTLKPCPLGFVYNASQQQCVCVDSDVIACDYTLAVSCISKGYWIGNTANNGISVAPCTSLFCKNNDDRFCEPCPISGRPEFCILPRTSVEQCLSNRSGVVCSECIDDYALTFGGVQCVHDYLCDNGKGFIPAILNIVFVIFTIAILIVMLKFNYKLSSGYLFGFIYYFSIVRHLLDAESVGIGVLFFISIPASFTQLNPQFLGYIPICFSTELSALQQQVFLYLNPLIISSFVLLVIAVSLRFTKIKFGDNTMVKAICLLMLLSFTALTETSFNIINPVHFRGIPGSLVNIQPSTKYLNLTEHLPYFIIAIIVFVFLVIPFTLLLLFAPLLTKCFNLNRIKPFLDEFQGCYKDRFRWMAGYYFIARLIYLVILTQPNFAPVSNQYIVQLLSLFILVFHMLLQPYENFWLNISDSLLLLDIVLMTLLFGTTANVTYKNLADLRIGIVSVLVVFPVLYLIAVTIMNVGNDRLRKTMAFEKITKWFVQHDESFYDKDRLGSNSYRYFSPGSELREELLDSYSEHKRRVRNIRLRSPLGSQDDDTSSTGPIMGTTVSYSVIGPDSSSLVDSSAYNVNNDCSEDSGNASLITKEDS